jgi:hypothetical protein
LVKRRSAEVLHNDGWHSVRFRFREAVSSYKYSDTTTPCATGLWQRPSVKT